MQTKLADKPYAPRGSRELAGKGAVVTGSTSGIGLAIAHSFAAVGMNVMLNGFGDETEIEAMRSDIETKYGVIAAYSAADMAKPTDIDAMLIAAIDHFGSVDVLVNNAGIFHVAAIETTPPKRWDDTIAVNLSSAFHTVRSVLPGMKARGWGRIINVASALGLVGAPNCAAYAASKHGIAGFTKSVALEAAIHGVTVNAICPGYVRTPLIEREIDEAVRTRGVPRAQVERDILAAVQPTMRFVMPGEIGGLAAFLCTGGAASITGAALPIDGGWTAR